MYSETNWHRSPLRDWGNEHRLVVACQSAPFCSAPAAIKRNNSSLQNNSYFAIPSVGKLVGCFISLLLQLLGQLISVQNGSSFPGGSRHACRATSLVGCTLWKAGLKPWRNFFHYLTYCFPQPRRMSHIKALMTIPVKTYSAHLSV